MTSAEVGKWLEETLTKHFSLKDYMTWWAKEIYGLHSTAMVVRPCTALVLWRSR
jgi:hypothetical protein